MLSSLPARRLIGLIATLAAAACLPLQAGADEWVRFPGAKGVTVRALVMKPTGNGPFPAIIALHGCAGLGNAKGLNPRHVDWGARLRDAGFVVVFPDSFGARGLGSQCTLRKRTIKAADRVQDAFATAQWLAAQADVDRRKIGLLGWSNGGTTLLNATNTGSAPKGVDFNRAVAFYPGCVAIAKKGYRPRLPVTILHGLADDWTAAAPCRTLAGVAFVGYPGAYHDFDHPSLPLRTRKAAFSANGSGTVTIGTNAEARADAIGRTMAIFEAMKATP